MRSRIILGRNKMKRLRNPPALMKRELMIKESMFSLKSLQAATKTSRYQTRKSYSLQYRNFSRSRHPPVSRNTDISTLLMRPLILFNLFSFESVSLSQGISITLKETLVPFYRLRILCQKSLKRYSISHPGSSLHH